MNDSRVDQVAQTIREIQAEPDVDMKVLLLLAAIDEWKGFADEFPATDMVIAIVGKRLRAAGEQYAAGQMSTAGVSLQVAANAVRAVQQR